MGYQQLDAVDRDKAQKQLSEVLAREDTATVIVLGDNEAVANDAKKVADENSPDTWWVVWASNPDLLTDEQRQAYTDEKSDNIACALSRSNQPVQYLTKQTAIPLFLLRAFGAAEAAD